MLLCCCRANRPLGLPLLSGFAGRPHLAAAVPRATDSACAPPCTMMRHPVEAPEAAVCMVAANTALHCGSREIYRKYFKCLDHVLKRCQVSRRLNGVFAR